jgi:putative phosphoribosyl transferase
MTALFADRVAAGRALARALAQRRWEGPVVVLALPRGGVPVAAEVARVLDAPLDLLLVRKIGAPSQPELAVAAVVDGTQPVIVVDEETALLAGVDREYIDARAQVELVEIARRRRVYLKDRSPVSVQGCTAIVVDDGIATGTTVRAALRALKGRWPARTVLAVPLAPADTLAALRGEVDEIVCLAEPSPFFAIGPHYDDFHQVEDAEVIAAMEAARSSPRKPPSPST